MESQPANMLNQVLGCFESLSVILAAGVAIYGIGTWKREHVGRRRIDLAEETLSLFYEAREVINGARSALGLACDTRALEQWANEQPRGAADPEPPPIITLRLSQRNELFSRIHALRYRFSAVFGREKAEPFYALVKLRIDIVCAEEEMSYHQRNLKTGCGDRSQLLDECKGLLPILHRGGVAEDPTTRRLDEIVATIEGVCRPVIDGSARLYLTRAPADAWTKFRAALRIPARRVAKHDSGAEQTHQKLN